MKDRTHFVRFVFVFILFSIQISLFGQKENTSNLKTAVVIEKLSGPVKFDGIIDENAWDAVTPIDLIMHSPVFGKDPTENTDVRIAYDDKYLYVGARLFCSESGLTKTVSLKRDFMGMGGDMFGIMLDTYNDKENAMAFFTSPDALRWDATIQKDAVPPRPDMEPMNISWNTFWDVNTATVDNGWTMEMRIPFSSLRFQEINGEVRMGLIVQRWIPGKNETDLFPAIPPNWGPYSAMKPSQAQEIVLRGVTPGKPIYLAPYLLAGYSASNDLNSSETAYDHSSKPVFEGGIDIKYGLSNNMIMDLTVNTDFAQVESDDQQINLTRYSLFFPEKRPFFLERASVFDYSLGGSSNMFYSRRIGLSDDGDPVRILGGARITGRVGKWDMGLLNMQTDALWKNDSAGLAEKIMPSENFGVVRFRRQVLNDNSFVGAIVTSRLGVDGTYNLGYGLDGIFRLFGDEYLDLKWSQTTEDSISNSSVMNPTRLSASWERRTKKGLGYNFGYSYSGVNYNPGIGFEMLDDYTSLRATIQYGWLPGEDAKLYSHSPQIRLRKSTYVEDGALMSFSLSSGWTFQTKNQWMGDITIQYNTENTKDSLVFKEDEVFVMPAQYSFISYRASLGTPGTKSFFILLGSEGGQYFDGTRISVNLQPTWNLSRHFELGCIYNFDRLKFDVREQFMINHIIGIKAIYMVDTKLSFNTYIQYNTAVNSILSNIRLRYNPKEGNDFFIVFNEGRNTNLTRELPNLPVYSARSVQMKYTYTFSL